MCIHETIQLSQDGEDIIICGDCGRMFGKIARDEKATFIAFGEPGGNVLVASGADAEAAVVVRVPEKIEGETLSLAPGLTLTYPCARCGFSMSCPELEGEPCHT